jgi:hypothetical protein
MKGAANLEKAVKCATGEDVKSKLCICLLVYIAKQQSGGTDSCIEQMKHTELYSHNCSMGLCSLIPPTYK